MERAGDHWVALTGLSDRYTIELKRVADDADIPGSYWGAPEAGLIGRCVYARSDTPLHSVLHEASHLVCMSPGRRERLHTDAGGAEIEECAVCFLQITLATELISCTVREACCDMDEWGYSFRLGSALAWFAEDAADARAWLVEHGLLTATGQSRPGLRGEGVTAVNRVTA
ncbi:MAG: hypothetical protein AAF610_06675 [Pseudomonadota bacterium]